MKLSKNRGVLQNVLLKCLVLLAALTFVLVQIPTTANAAETSGVTQVTLNPSTVTRGTQGLINIDFSNISEKTYVKVPSNIVVSSTGSAGDFATVSASDGIITIVPKSEIVSGTATLNFSYITDIAEGISETLSFDVTTDTSQQPYTVDATVVGAKNNPDLPSWYYPAKWGSAHFTDQGTVEISWSTRGPTGPTSDVTVTDTLGAGQKMECSTLSGTVRSWDQQNARDKWVSSLDFSQATGSCTDEGFTYTFKGVNIPNRVTTDPTLSEPRGTDIVYYPTISYSAISTDDSVGMSAQGWENSTNWTYDSGAKTIGPAYAKIDANSKGKRKLAISKNIGGNTEAATGKIFDISVDCQQNGESATGFPQQVALTGGQTSSVLAPVGSTCSASEPDPNGASSTVIGQDVNITNDLAQSFAIDITNTFPYLVKYVAPEAEDQSVIPSNESFDEGSAVNVIFPESVPTRQGYTFSGWKDEISNQTYSFEGTTTFTMPNRDVTLTAQWTKNVVPVVMHTVTFDSLGGTSIPAQEVADGTEVTSPAPPTKTGYVFSGWYTDSDFSSAYDFATPVTQDITLYAKWVAEGQQPSQPNQGGTPASQPTLPSTGVAVAGIVLGCAVLTAVAVVALMVSKRKRS